MTEHLHQPFDAYMALVAQRAPEQRPRRGGSPVAVIPNRAAGIAATVNALQASTQFKELVRATRDEFRDDFHSAKSDDRWSRAVSTFFKVGGCYGEPVWPAAPSDLFDAYCNAFRQRVRTIRYLALLEFTEFARPRLDCGTFEIRRFSKAELDVFLRSDVSRSFYGYAVADTAQLCAYWFLVVQREEAVRPVSTIMTVDLSAMGSAFPSYRLPPAPIEEALRVLALFDWELATPSARGEQPDGWMQLQIPLFLESSDHLLDPPRAAPDTSVLATETRADVDGEEFEVRVIDVEVSEGACGQLEGFCCRVNSALRKFPSGHHWHFFEVAMTYFIRAFLTRGIDQLLWHMTALEALLGGGPPEPIQRVGKRLGVILGDTRAVEEKIRRRFKELYALRCDLVHGNRVLDSIAATELADTRQLARKAMLWFAHGLHLLQSEAAMTNCTEMPSRTELLAVLDFDEKQRRQVGALIAQLPPMFPRIREWLV
ncbi:MAG: hypothetical protein ACRDUX_35540 [Mycobacterium sp.]